MGSEIAVSVRGISKKYRLFDSPSDRFREALHPFGKKYHREFWALRDLSFDIKKGTTTGIIGRNGSGKTTLLEIICGVLKPTAGELRVGGRVSALLELGAGFNPEFTGIENLKINGALMGFSPEEVKKRIPVIEEFADIGEFISQPLKTYSSGMMVRLAFAAAINIDPEILIVDEALAVGDAKFQNKCYRKFNEFQEAGKTIIFVTHDMNAVNTHCDHAVLLEKGGVIEQGRPERITNFYLDLLFTGGLTGYAKEPVMKLESYHGFNIIHFKEHYLAIAQAAGPIDLMKEDLSALSDRLDDDKFFIAVSFEEAKAMVDDHVKGAAEKASSPVRDEERIPELAEFLRSASAEQNCQSRPGYNKNEFRHGDRKGEIIDFTLSDGDKSNAFHFASGSEIHLYLKCAARSALERPWFGFALNTLDGVMIYGTNTFIAKTQFRPLAAGEIVFVKYSFRLPLNAGDYFIDLGFGGAKGCGIENSDRRAGMIHIVVYSETDRKFTGHVDLNPDFAEVAG